MSNSKNYYLNLLKQCLVFSLWPQPPMELETRISQTRFQWATGPARLMNRLLARVGLVLCVPRSHLAKDIREGTTWPGYGETMVGIARLNNIEECVLSVVRDGIEGAMIETGVWRGGACIFINALLQVEDPQRTLYVCDSFQGLPRPSMGRDMDDQAHAISYLRVGLEEVKENFRRYGLLTGNVRFVPGWFRDTLPEIEGPLSLIRLDGDLYESTMDALVNLYPKLSRGGYCIVDDYGLAKCRAAVDDYRNTHRIREHVMAIDRTGIYWRKSL